MTTERFTHFDLFKVASRTVKLMVIACKFTLFLSSLMRCFVPIVTCFVRYINTSLFNCTSLSYSETHFQYLHQTFMHTQYNHVKQTWHTHEQLI